MKTTWIKSKYILFSVITISLTFIMNPSAFSHCNSCSHHRVYHRVKYHGCHRPACGYSISVYYPVAVCGYCGGGPGCGCVNNYIPATWVSHNEEVYYQGSPNWYIYTRADADYDFHYDPDLSTGDDDATEDPNMNIDH